MVETFILVVPLGMPPLKLSKIDKPCWMSDHEVKRHEKTLTPNIISIEDILYLKTSDCQLEVNESNAM